MIKYPIAALIVVVALLGGFYGGYKIGGGGTASAANNTTTGAGRIGGTGVGAGRAAACPSPGATPSATASGPAAARRGATGTISNLTTSSLTIHDARCNTDVKVTFDQSVIVRKTVVGQSSDLQETETITVTGTRQTDGSIKANSINIVPAGSAGFGGVGANGG